MEQEIEFNHALRDVQLACIQILKEFHKLCERHNLRYYLAYGTLLGSIRHQGYIPWDDDIDVWMPRPDFERFLKIAQDEVPLPYVINYFSVDNDAAFKYRTLLCIEDHSYPVGFYLGGKVKPGYIWIDIIPMDGMPKGNIAKKIQCLRFSFWYMMIGFARSSMIGASNQNSKSKIKRLGIFLNERLGLGKRLDIRKCFCRFKRVKMRYAYDESMYVHGSTTYYTKKSIFPRSAFYGKRQAIFEGMAFDIPQGTEQILSAIYGDYMNPPPIDKRGQAHFTLLQTEKKGGSARGSGSSD